MDQQILLKEKLTAIWNEKHYERTGPYDIKHDIKQRKEERFIVNQQQREGYNNVLKFIKERESIPVAEEKQLLDCLNLVLDNGWTVTSDDLKKIFDLLELRDKIHVSDENQEILEFFCLIGMLMKIDTSEIESYFTNQS